MRQTIILIWGLRPTLAVFQLYHFVIKLYKFYQEFRGYWYSDFVLVRRWVLGSSCWCQTSVLIIYANEMKYLTYLLKQRRHTNTPYMIWSRILLIRVVHNTYNFEGAYWQQMYRFQLFVFIHNVNEPRCSNWNKISQIPKKISSLPVYIDTIT